MKKVGEEEEPREKRTLSQAARKMINYVQEFGKDLAREVSRDEILDLIGQLETWEKHRVLQEMRRAEMSEDAMVYGMVKASIKRAFVANELRAIAKELEKL